MMKQLVIAKTVFGFWLPAKNHPFFDATSLKNWSRSPAMLPISRLVSSKNWQLFTRNPKSEHSLSKPNEPEGQPDFISWLSFFFLSKPELALVWQPIRCLFGFLPHHHLLPQKRLPMRPFPCRLVQRILQRPEDGWKGRLAHVDVGGAFDFS